MKYDFLIAFCLALTVLTLVLLILVLYMRFSKSRKNLIKKASEDARRIKMEAIASARVDIAKIKHDAETDITEQLSNMEIAKNDFSRKREMFFRELERLGLREEQLTNAESANIKVQHDLSLKLAEVNNKLANIANMSLAEVKEAIWENVRIELASEISIKEEALKNEARASAQKVATQILVQAMEKTSVDLVTTTSITRVSIPNAEMKGKIIGKEGRNIKAFEQYGGVDIVIDDAPNSISVSSFNPIRREIAVNALKSLIVDGRIQPVRIEEALIEEEKKLNQVIEQAGTEALNELAIYDLPEEIKFLIGKLKFRTSYNQNVLKHCMEVAKIAATMASELNLDSYVALKAGLLHDIGKAVDYEQEGSHVALGIKLLKKAGIKDPIILNAIEAHHDDVKRESIIAEIISIADTVSAARPGARNNNVEAFFIRMDDIETRIKSISGVKNAFVLQSGRQVRVIVDPEIIEDQKLKEITNDVKKTIEEDNKTPGEIVITVIREKRMISRINSGSQE